MASQREVPVDVGDITVRDVDDPDRHDVDADVLVRIIQGLQKAVRLLAAQEEGLHVAKRFKPSKDLREHYTLLLGVPTQGSYSQPLQVVDRRPTSITDPIDGVEPFFPLQGTMALLDAVAKNDLPAARLAVPDERIRHFVLDAVTDIIPERQWSVELSTGGLSAYVDTKSRETALKWLEMRLPEEKVDIVGELVAIDFTNKRIKLQHPPTGRLLEAEYDLDIEEDLLRERRDMVQVSGVAMVDDEANPIELVEVTAINHIDLTPILVERVDVDDVHLVAREPLALAPSLSPEDSQFFEVRVDRLGIDAYARTRETLLPALLDEIAFVWQCYALEDPDNLTADAQALRTRLLSAFEVG